MRRPCPTSRRATVAMPLATACCLWLVVVVAYSWSLFTPPAMADSLSNQHHQQQQQQKEPQQSQQSQQSQQQQQQQHQQHQQHQQQWQQQQKQALSLTETHRYRDRCWRANYSSPDQRPVDHTPLPFLQGSPETATGPSCHGDYFLLVMVQTAVPNRPRRDLIRRTWASVANIDGDRVATVFFVGTTSDPTQSAALRQESDSQGDIIQADFTDSYRNLTYKHLYALRWISERCQSVRYVAKVDDDVVLNVFHLRETLKEKLAAVHGDFFYCQVTEVSPIRSRGWKWYVTRQEWPGDKYPPYCKGFGYVMTGSLVVRLHQCAKWRRYFWVDDVFVSGDLASALGVPLIQWEDGWGVRSMHPRLDGPEARELVVATEGGNLVLPSLHRRVWRAMLRHSGEC